MLEIINKLFDKHTWVNLLVIVLMLLTFIGAAVYGISKYPISFTLTQSEIRDEVYETHDKTYRIYSEKSDGTMNVHVNIIDKIRKEAVNHV